jgi:hypothetical protein
MSKEASWIAAMLTVLLIVMALLSPQTEGRLPTLEAMEKPPATIIRAPLVGPIIGRIQHQMIGVTWQLEAIPIE